jgi:hypothetical protein
MQGHTPTCQPSGPVFSGGRWARLPPKPKRTSGGPGVTAEPFRSADAGIAGWWPQYRTLRSFRKRQRWKGTPMIRRSRTIAEAI